MKIEKEIIIIILILRTNGKDVLIFNNFLSVDSFSLSQLNKYSLAIVIPIKEFIRYYMDQWSGGRQVFN